MPTTVSHTVVLSGYEQFCDFLNYVRQAIRSGVHDHTLKRRYYHSQKLAPPKSNFF